MLVGGAVGRMKHTGGGEAQGERLSLNVAALSDEHQAIGITTPSQFY